MTQPQVRSLLCMSESESPDKYIPVIAGELVLGGGGNRAGGWLDQVDGDQMRGTARLSCVLGARVHVGPSGTACWPLAWRWRGWPAWVPSPGPGLSPSESWTGSRARF